MLLPTGQVLFGPSTTDLRCCTPDGEPQEAWRPVVTQVIPHCGHAGIDYYLLRGTQLNGLSQANIYGDDCTPATNYPLVRLRSVGTGAVYYSRTYDFSSMAVSTGSKAESVRFDASRVSYGDFELCVVANGISSHCMPFCHRHVRQPCASNAGRCCADGPAAGHGSDCCCEETRIDPHVARLQAQVGTLQRSVQRIGTWQPQRFPSVSPRRATRTSKLTRKPGTPQADAERLSRRRRSPEPPPAGECAARIPTPGCRGNARFCRRPSADGVETLSSGLL